MARLGFEPMISRPEVDRANTYSIGPLLENWQVYLSIYIVMRQKVSLGLSEFW